MRISIVLFDSSAISRIKDNTYKYFGICDEKKETDHIVWIENMSIEFQNRLIIIYLQQGEEGNCDSKIKDYLDAVLMNNEVAINYGKRIEYNKHYGESQKLVLSNM